MLKMKFDNDWPAGLRDIYVWKCERTHGRTEKCDFWNEGSLSPTLSVQDHIL